MVRNCLGGCGDGDGSDSRATGFVTVEDFIGMIQHGFVSVFIKIFTSYGVSDWEWQLLPEQTNDDISATFTI